MSYIKSLIDVDAVEDDEPTDPRDYGMADEEANLAEHVDGARVGSISTETATMLSECWPW